MIYIKREKGGSYIGQRDAKYLFIRMIVLQLLLPYVIIGGSERIVFEENLQGNGKEKQRSAKGDR